MAVSTISVPGKADGFIVPTSYLNSEYFEIHSGGYAKYGHMVFLNLRVISKKVVPAGALKIFANGAFPLPLQDNNGTRVAQVLPGYIQNAQDQINPYVTGNGSLDLGSVFSGVQNSTSIWIGGCYLTDS